MGYFGSAHWSAGRWSATPTGAEPWLSLTIHDSDIATVRFGPGEEPALGLFYLGVHPVDYFNDPAAGTAVDAGTESRAFATWVARATGRDLPPERVRALIAVPGGPEPDDDFVEDTVERLLDLAGIDHPDLDEFQSS